MRAIQIEVGLREYLLLGQSFGICRGLHLWPPLVTFNKFLECGVDDLEVPPDVDRFDGFTMTWEPFELSSEEYQEVVRLVDPDGSFDPSRPTMAIGSDGSVWRRIGCSRSAVHEGRVESLR